MASIKYGPVVADARGSVAGTVFSRNRFGSYMKQRVTPTFPGTDRQNAATALMANVVDTWVTDLTVAQREAWNLAASLFTVPNRLGDAVTLTGLQWYGRCNILLALSTQALVTAPPPKPIMPAPTLTLAHTAGVGIEATAIGVWDTAETDRVLANWSAALQQTINYFKGPWIATWGQNAALYDVLPALMTPVGMLVASTRLFYRFRSVKADGANSFPVIYSVDVGDPV